jgi:two-component system chemotaxis response regulator CheY
MIVRAGDQQRGDDMHVLIVDDSTTMRMILKAHLKKLGFEVTEAINGRDALVRLKAMATADLVMVDWNMPEMDGLAFVRAVRTQEGYAELPLMMVTTNTDREHVEQALEAGANEYIMKPFTGDMIREKLEILGLLAA